MLWHCVGTIADHHLYVQEATDIEFERIAQHFDKLTNAGVPVYHVVGNHCLCVPRERLVQRLSIPSPSCYYAVSLPGGWRLVVLDTTEMIGERNTYGQVCTVLHIGFGTESL